MNVELPISGELLSTSVKNLLLDRITKGYYKPGDRIVEFQLCKELGTSQSPVREALRELASIGVVTIHSRRGARVRLPTTKELVDNTLVRSEIDALAATLATPLLDQDTLDKLSEAYDDMQRHQASNNYAGMTQADAHFHRLIAVASGNATILQSFDRLEPFARTFITLTIPAVNLKSIIAEHKLILDALEMRDAPLAATRAREHQLAVGVLLNTHYDPGPRPLP
jgi:DNA-binding GntR family transcriptional regulator